MGAMASCAGGCSAGGPGGLGRLLPTKRRGQYSPGSPSSPSTPGSELMSPTLRRALKRSPSRLKLGAETKQRLTKVS